MPPYLKLGSIPRKRHIAHRQEPGFHGEGIAYEEVVTAAGFGRAYTILYHLRPPTRVSSIEPVGSSPLEFAAEPVLRHHHFKTGAICRKGDVISGRVPLLANDDVVLSRCRPSEPQTELYRNAAADEVLFVHRGSGATPYDVRPASLPPLRLRGDPALRRLMRSNSIRPWSPTC